MNRARALLHLASACLVMAALVGCGHASEPVEDDGGAPLEEVVGRLQVVIIEGWDGTAQGITYLNTDDGRGLRLLFRHGEPGYRTGARVRALGRFTWNDRFEVEVIELLEDAPPPYVAPPRETGQSSRSVAVVLFHFADDNRAPVEHERVRDVLWTGERSVRNYFLDSSYGQLRFDGLVDAERGDVFGWYTIAAKNQGCDPFEWARQARQAAANAGADLLGYDHVVFSFPSATDCGWAGLAIVGGSDSWIQGSYFQTRVVAHELGHNLGLGHAGSLSCTQDGHAVSLSDSCTFQEYGDPFDVMGNAPGASPLHAFHRGRVGWLLDSNVVTLVDPGTHVVELAPLWVSTSQPQMLRLQQGREVLHVEFRVPGSAFDESTYFPPTALGVFLRRSAEEPASPSALLDMTPGDGSFINARLPADATFEKKDDFRITVLSDWTGAAVLEVTLLEDALPPSPPTGVTVESSAAVGTVIRWEASTDNRGVSAYLVYRRQPGQSEFTELTRVEGDQLSASDPVGLSGSHYRVVAVDEAENVSAPSESACAEGLLGCG